MRLLLDTHALLWWFDDNRVLSREARDAISRPENIVLVSAVTAWEIVIKARLRKLRAPRDLDREIEAHGFDTLPITLQHALRVGRLPDHHEDPFDRMLVAQALVEGLTLVTRDANIPKYAVQVIEA